MNDVRHQNENDARSASPSSADHGQRESRSTGRKFLGLALMLNVLLWSSISCSGDIGSVMGLDDPALEIAGIRVEPSSVTLSVGESELFSAVTSDDGDDETLSEVTWASLDPEVAAVDEEGEVEARGPGSATIIASDAEGEEASATVEVIEDDQPESGSDSGSSESSGSHEPHGFDPITERAFDRSVEDGWTASGGIDMQIVKDDAAPRSPSSVGQIRYPAGFSGGRTPTFTTRSGLEDEGYRELYVSFWLKLSENWQGHKSSVNKIGFIWMHDNPVVFPANIIWEGEGVKPQVMVQGTPEGSRNLALNVNDLRVERGEWVHWEILLVANSGDARDGEAHWWINGEKVGEHTDVLYGDSGQSSSWQTVAWRPTWGGAGDIVEEDMHMWMDHMYVSGAR